MTVRAGRYGVRAGQEVTTLLGAANRDPQACDRPDAFDIHRATATEHLALSSGIHCCVGAPLDRYKVTLWQPPGTAVSQVRGECFRIFLIFTTEGNRS